MIELTGNGLRLWLPMFDEEREPLSAGAATYLYKWQNNLPCSRRFHKALRLFDLDAMPLGVTLRPAEASSIELSTPNDSVTRFSWYCFNGLQVYMVMHTSKP